MERKMNVADFAALVGTSTKTIYEKINNSGELPVIEQLITVNEKVKGRTIKLIVTNSEQIEYYKNLYGKNTVIDGEYYENVTVNNLNKPVNEVQETVKNNNSNGFNGDIFERLITVNNEFNNRIEQLTNRVIAAESKQLLLEDKASREGTYINEINELKKDNNRYKLFIKLLITVIVTLLIVITGYITFNIGLSTTEQSSVIESTKNEQMQVAPAHNIKK